VIMAHPNKLTAAQAAALAAARRGPLFRRRASWGRAGLLGTIASATVDVLVGRGLLERATTRHGVPMVRLTDAGRDAGEGRLNGARRLVEQIEAARELHERIAP